ncbi:PREDICTED: uncharacterized protein KIAA1211 homolog [Dipodomys ordii]|uniref:Uncharacterized protein KIAA1211 homolog n=1 Tax=Dipodomys ordii TaxID=10020 RepID=A0A1S3EK98_DIPOR|nr:PREDICTED: uncharacterized protein KIAA1211 homolog [Dipodomys ordii]
MGTRAFSHDSIFIPDGGAESEQTVQAMSQDNILGKVKTLQRQLGKNIKFGQRPSNAIPMKKAGSGEAGSEEDLFLTSPMEIVTQQDAVLSDSENKSSDPPGSPSPLNLPGAGSEMEDKVAPVKPSRPKRHFSSAGTIESVNLDAIPLAIARLDNSAAKHKLAVKPKNQRVSRKHRRLAQDRQNDTGILESQSSLDQNGHQGEDKPICHEEEPEPLDSEEEKRCQEDYWRELEAKCRRQKAEAAEKRRLEEQRLQALERRLWEENQRQELLQEEAEEEGLQEGLKLESERGQQRGLEEQSCQEQEQREQEAQEHLEAAEQRCLWEEAQQLEGLRWQEAERQRQEEEMKETQRLEALKAQQQEAEKRRLEEEARRLKEEETRKLKEEEARRLEEEARRLEKAKRLEEEKARRLEEEKAKRLEEEKARRLEEEKARRLEEEKARRLAAARTPPVQKPALAPKPTGQTPPSSPLSKLSRPYLVELLARRAGKADSEPPKEAPESGEPQPPSPPPCEDSKGQKGDEEEGPERRPPSSPPLPASQQERPAQTPEAGRKDKPLLQSRHSLDGSRLTDKAETAQPLWITLALQKQKGFREQQATREERKQAREAKQVEKLSKENVSVSSQPGSSSVSRAGSLHKSTAQPEEKKPETAVSRLQRREQLKKANTLPTSVTVEISDSAPPAPLVKEVTKRFSTPDAAPVSTEPAWLALAKRKAKAWSDCPQIIK